MRRLLDTIQARLTSFVEQRRELALIVKCRDEDNLLLVKMLEALDKGDASTEIFWIFTEPFEAPAAYVQSIIEAFRARHADVCNVQVKAGEAPWPSIPEEVISSQSPPVERLRRCLVFARRLLPDPTDGLLVVALCPTRVSDAASHARFIAELLRHELPKPWCHNMRLVVREDVAAPLLSENWRTLPRTQWYALDLSQSSMQKALEDEVNDDALPLPQRLQGLLLLAGIDYAHRRYPEAAEKYKLLSRYYHATGNLPMLGLVLNGLGEATERSGQRSLAQRHYEAALTPAIESKAAPVLINIGLNLGRFHEEDRRWRESLEYYRGVVTLADASLNAPLKIFCLGKMGTCAYRMGDPSSGEQHWEAATRLARGLEAPEQRRELLKLRKELYRELGMARQRGEVELELSSLDAGPDRRAG
jgi:tetratricopeptide (TPR) repeat protein